MTTTMKHKRSSVAGNAPDAADIETGELAINFPDAALYTKDGSGNIIELSITDAIKEPVKNVSGGSLSVGTVVYQSGTAGNSAEVQAASNTSASTMPALGIITSTLADEGEGYAVLIGKINGLNTSSFSEGDTLYVGASGTLTTTVPSGEGALIQNIGKVLKVHASNGSIMVTGAGRTNATPNLNDGNIFIGNSSNQATTASFNTTVDTHLNQSAAGANSLLRWNGTDYDWYDSASTMTTYNYTATANQTSFSGNDDNTNALSYSTGMIIVTVNGIVYEDGTDYTATSGTSIIFTSGLELNDEVNVIAFTNHNLSNLDYNDLTNKPTIPTDFVSAASGGTFSGNVAMTGDLTVDTNTLHVDSTNDRVGIGTSSPARELSIGDGTGSPNIQLLASNTGNSRLEFGDTDDSDVGEIQYLHGDNAMLFHVNAAERMRIDTTGNVLVAKNSTTVGDVGSMLKSNGQIFSTTNGSDSFHNYDTSQNRYEFYVKGNGGIANYSSNNVNLSDQTEKKNITAAASVWDDVKGFALKEFHYNFEDDADPKQLGVIAQEVQVNHPDLIKSFKIDDSTTKLGVVEQQVTWMAIKALQEAMTKIETLETQNADILQRLETLENNNE